MLFIQVTDARSDMVVIFSQHGSWYGRGAPVDVQDAVDPQGRLLGRADLAGGQLARDALAQFHVLALVVISAGLHIEINETQYIQLQYILYS